MHTNFEVPFVEAPVSIKVDEWGVPHIEAKTKADVFFGQGFNAARDRLWQLDFFRRRGLGKLAEVFGPDLIPWDRAARRLLYRGDMRAEWIAYADDTKAIVEAFVAGINAYIELVAIGEVPLPKEFQVLGYEPEAWHPEDVTRMRAHGLYFNVVEETKRSYVLSRWNEDIEALRSISLLEHELVSTPVEDWELLPRNVLEEYEYGTLPVNFKSVNLPDLGVKRIDTSMDGSNNWVLSGKKTKTGRPIVANDPHRVTNQLPSLRYIAHLKCDDFNVIGGGEPALPGVSIGHNGSLAFGLTIFAIDQEDFMVLELDPNDDRRYRYQDDWRRFDVIEETISVKGSEDVTVKLDFSVHGPVLWKDSKKRRAGALKAAWLEPGGVPYLGSIQYMRSRSIQEFLDSMNRWGTPPENQVVADTSGSIAWKAGGIVPNRHNWDGRVPVPGNGEYEWDGFLSGDQLPSLVNPESGWIATANERRIEYSKNSPHISYDWYADYRARRLKEVFSQDEALSVEDCSRIQMDTKNLLASDAVSLIQTNGGLETPLWEELESWDFRMETDSATATLWEFWWWRVLTPTVLREAIERSGFSEDETEIMEILYPKDQGFRDPRGVFQWLHDLIESEWDSAKELLEITLAKAAEELEARLGSDRQGWAWGNLHKAQAVHPLADLLQEKGIDARQVRTERLPATGSGETVGLASYGDDFTQIAGSTFRVVIDVGDWDKSIAANSPGQSGDITSTDAQEHFRLWASNETFPLIYSDELIAQHVRHVFTLSPIND